MILFPLYSDYYNWDKLEAKCKALFEDNYTIEVCMHILRALFSLNFMVAQD